MFRRKAATRSHCGSAARKAGKNGVAPLCVRYSNFLSGERQGSPLLLSGYRLTGRRPIEAAINHAAPESDVAMNRASHMVR